LHHLLQDIGIAIFTATLVGIIFHFIKQPIILAYLVAGMLIGPAIGFKLVTDPDSIEVISEIGLILLLFIIGLEINLQKIISAGKAMLIAGVGQFMLSVLLGTGFFILLGYSFGGGSLDAVYLAIFCALSSTAIVVKLLYDKFELDTFPGRISLGILIFQDIWAILILAFQPNFTNPKLILVGLALVKSAGLMIMGYLLSKYLLRFIYEKIAKSPEMVVAVSIAWCAFMAGVASYIGLSKEMGGLIAGVVISSFPFSIHITAKVLPLRDFFLTLFFLSLGMKIPAPESAMIIHALIIVLFVIISRYLIVYPLLALSGSGRRVSFISSLNLAQISEFSLVIAALGVTYGHLKEEIMSLIIYSMAITSVLSSYLIKSNHQIYSAINNLLGKLGLGVVKEDFAQIDDSHHPDVVILGYHRAAAALVAKLERTKPELLKKILVVDFNIEVLTELRQKGIKGIFGDISSPDTLEHSHIIGAKFIFLTIPDMLLKGTSNAHLVKICRTISPNSSIVATADSTKQIELLKAIGATEVILPYSMIGSYLSDFLLKHLSKT